MREFGRTEPVDADTLFPAASIPKAFTTLLLAELVDKKKLRWDEPVIEAIRFQTRRRGSTSQVQIRHLVCSIPAFPASTEWSIGSP